MTLALGAQHMATDTAAHGLWLLAIACRTGPPAGAGFDVDDPVSGSRWPPW